MNPIEESLDDVIPTETAPATGPSRRLSRRDRAAAIAGGGVLLLSPLYFVKAPLTLLWWLQLLLSEQGHWACVGLLALAWRATAAWPRRLALAGALLSLWPLAQAWRLQAQLRAETAAAWGAEAQGTKAPLRVLPLFLPSLGWGVERSTEVFDEEHGLKLDLWSRRDDQGLMTRRPVVLVLHGGGWDSGSRGGFKGFNHRLARKGWVVADMDYRLAPQHPWPAQREDVMRALEHLRLNARRLNVDPEHVVILGRSAGAHLALDFAYGTQDSAIQGVIAFYGPSDLRWAWEHSSAWDPIDSLRLLEQLCAGKPGQSACFDDASPLALANQGSPPTLLLHGRLDSLVWPEHSRRLAEKLRQEGVALQALELPWGVHGFDLSTQSPGGQASAFVIERFLADSERRKLLRKRL